jgi:hypothetical protein
MMKGELKVLPGFSYKMPAAMSHVLPESTLAKMHAAEAAPGTARQKAEEAKSRQRRNDHPAP